ncbi:histidine acid phosphatase-like protein [Tothia fuscella]|uniref:Histidine acid phosphatase-like protein n=1 Tax=Tothia fuscella TaxID=1048955 RepID=A0A9P4TX26_9PEZI|nr:histidine acid phosphatase-like protein [Tothia fuscella]
MELRTAALLLFSSIANSLPAYQPLQSPLLPQDHTQNYQFNPLLHLPGTSPYFDAIGFGLQHKVPDGCKVTAASYLIRHAAIYANDDEYETYIKPFLWKLEQNRNGWRGDLKFMEKWHSPILEDRLEEITPSGAEDAMKVGKHLSQLYPELVGTVKKVLADKKPRTFDTAKALVKAFPQHDGVEVVRITHDINGSMDALIPHKSCPNFSKEPGTKEMAEFVSNFAHLVADRLAPFMPFRLSNNDVIGLQGLCGYESAINGRQSKICSVFTDVEWMAYEYAWDLKYAHMVGPLNPLSPYLGIPWLESQSQLFEQLDDSNNTDGTGWPEGQRFFLSFTHREVPPFVATALGIFNSSSSEVEEFPTDHINWVRSWRMSDLIPFLGHVGMEKMSCDASSGLEGKFVRVVANTAPRPIPNCQSGPGASCPFGEFKETIAAGAEKYSDIHGVCGESDK